VANTLEPLDNQAEVFKAPTEDQWVGLDHYGRDRLQAEIEEVQGVVVDQEIPLNRLNVSQLAAEFIVRDVGIVTRAGYAFPKIPRSQRKDPEASILHMAGDTSREQALAFGHAFLPENEVVYRDMSGDSLLDQVVAIGSLATGRSAVCMPLDHPLQSVFRAWYTEFSNLKNHPAVLASMSKDGVPGRERFVVQYSQQIPVVPELEGPELFARKGLSWAIRHECNFDAHEFCRRRARGEYQNRGA
jgi:hypothetical protein